MTFTEKIKVITTVYTDLRNIEYEGDLKHHNLSVSDYHAAIDIFNDISRPGTKTETFITSVAEFYKRHGYTVTPGTVNYTISI